MSASCPVCYESFVFTDENHHHSARKLHCGDILCYDCIKSEIFDNTYYCPECGRDYRGATADEFSEFISNPNALENPNNNSPNSNTDISSTLLDPNSPTSPNDSFYRESRRISLRMPCLEPGCKNKAIAAGLCMFHASMGAKNSPGTKAVVQESKIAKNMEANSDLSDIYMSRGMFETRNKTTSIHPDDIIRRFKNQQRIELGEAMEILNTARSILSKESNILRIDAPVIAVGDIHGQFYDLLNLLEEGGKPSENSTPYLFLGDYVDRGSFSCEVLFTLLALKIAYPDKIFLLRGNHESGSVSSHFGFKQECKRKYGVNVYHRALLVFQTMPIASIISTAFGDIYACHGGLSPTLQTLDQIEALDRFVEPEMNSGLLDILWSDPISENAIDDVSDEMYEEFLKVNWKPNPARGCSYCFGYTAVKEFLNKNGLVCIVRAHEVQADGFRRHFEPKVVENRLRSLLLTRVSELAEQNDEDNDVDDDDNHHHFTRPAMKRKPSVAEATTAAEKVLKSEMITEKDFPPVITIFSAPNYCDRYGNKAAILHIDSALDGFRVIQYDCVEHPVPDISDSQTENYMDAIIVACPYMPSSFRDFVKLALQLGPDESLVGELENFHMSKSSMSSLEAERASVVEDNSDDEVDGPIIQAISVDEIVIPTVAHTVKSSSTSISSPSLSSSTSSPSSKAYAQQTQHQTQQQQQQEPPPPPPPPSSSSLESPGHDTPRAKASKRRSLTINIVAGDSLDMLTSDDPRASGGFIDNSKLKHTAKRDSIKLLLSDEPTIHEIPNYRDSMELRRKSASEVLKKSSSMKKVFPDTYMQALASDSINEVHPEALTSFIQGAMNQKFFGGDEQDKAIQFQFPQKEMAAVSVSELRKRYEKAANGNVFSEFDNWRQSQANIQMEQQAAAAELAAAVVEVVAKPAAAVVVNQTKVEVSPINKITSISKRSSSVPPSPFIIVKRTATLTELDKCQRFDDIIAKFGGSSKKNSFNGSSSLSSSSSSNSNSGVGAGNSVSSKHNGLGMEILDNSSDDPTIRRMSTGRLNNREDSLARREELLRNHNNGISHTESVKLERQQSDPIVTSEAVTKIVTLEKVSKAKSRRASSFDPKLANMVNEVMKDGSINHEEEFHGSRTPFTGNDTSVASTTESSLSSTTTKETRESFDHHLDHHNHHPDHHHDKEVVFTSTEILALRLMFSMYDRSGSATIEYEDLVAYAQETDDMAGIHDADIALDILDIDGDGKIGLLDFIHFAGRLKKIHQDKVASVSAATISANA